MTLEEIKRKCVQEEVIYFRGLPDEMYQELCECIRQTLVQISLIEEAEPLYVLQILFLNTAFYFGETRIRLQGILGENGWEHPVAIHEVNCEWMMEPFRLFEKRLRIYQESENKTREWLQYETREMLPLYLKLAGYFLKYPVRDVCLEDGIQVLPKASNFGVEYGQIAGFRMLFHMDAEEIDLLKQQNEVVLRYRKYRKKRFKKSKIAGKNLSNSIFYDCKFESFAFVDVNLNDCIFENCIFVGTQFFGGSVYGTQFINCCFIDTITENVCTTQERITEEGIFRAMALIECGEESDALF